MLTDLNLPCVWNDEELLSTLCFFSLSRRQPAERSWVHAASPAAILCSCWIYILDEGWWFSSLQWLVSKYYKCLMKKTNVQTESRIILVSNLLLIGSVVMRSLLWPLTSLVQNLTHWCRWEHSFLFEPTSGMTKEEAERPGLDLFSSEADYHAASLNYDLQIAPEYWAVCESGGRAGWAANTGRFLGQLQGGWMESPCDCADNVPQ